MNFITLGRTKEFDNPWEILNKPPIGYAKACTAATGEFANALPASIDPSSIFDLAFILCPSNTAVLIDEPRNLSASIDNIFETGLLFEFIDVKASIAWTIASIPVDAVILAGKLIVNNGSKIARSGNINLEETPFFSLSSIVIIEIGVTSDPVPAVVGISTSGSLGPFALLTPHIVSICWFDPRSKDTSFATSIDEPPPKPKTPVDSNSLASLNALNNVFFDGSDSTLLNILTLQFFFSFLIVGSSKPNSVRPLSETTNIFLPNISIIWLQELREVSLPKINPAVE